MSTASLRARYLSDRVATASPQQLLVMLYDRLALDLERGEDLLVRGEKQAAGEQARHAILLAVEEANKGDKPVVELCKDRGISEATFYTWRKKFGGMQTRDVLRMRELEKENARLKRLLAERDLELDVVKEALTKNW